MAASGSTALTIAADGVGGISAALGALLTVAPQTGGRWLGLGASTVTPRRRVLGSADLALGITIVAGRSRPWRWRAVAARALLHLVFARAYVQSDRRAVAVAMCALFVVDAGSRSGSATSLVASEAMLRPDPVGARPEAVPSAQRSTRFR